MSDLLEKQIQAAIRGDFRESVAVGQVCLERLRSDPRTSGIINDLQRQWRRRVGLLAILWVVLATVVSITHGGWLLLVAAGMSAATAMAVVTIGGAGETVRQLRGVVDALDASYSLADEPNEPPCVPDLPPGFRFDAEILPGSRMIFSVRIPRSDLWNGLTVERRREIENSVTRAAEEAIPSELRDSAVAEGMRHGT